MTFKELLNWNFSDNLSFASIASNPFVILRPKFFKEMVDQIFWKFWLNEFFENFD